MKTPMDLEGKIKKVMQLVTKNCYDKNYNPINTKDKKLWDLCDFGYEKEFNIVDGKCSLKASLEFSMEEWENKVDNDLQYLINNYGI